MCLSTQGAPAQPAGRRWQQCRGRAAQLPRATPLECSQDGEVVGGVDGAQRDAHQHLALQGRWAAVQVIEAALRRRRRRRRRRPCHALPGALPTCPGTGRGASSSDSTAEGEPCALRTTRLFTAPAIVRFGGCRRLARGAGRDRAHRSPVCQAAEGRHAAPAAGSPHPVTTPEGASWGPLPARSACLRTPWHGFRGFPSIVHHKLPA